MPQLLVEEVFIGGSVSTAIQAADLPELRDILRRLGTRDIDLRSPSQPADRSTTVDALTQADFDWLIHSSAREPRMIVIPFRPDVAVESIASQPPPGSAGPDASPIPAAPKTTANPEGRHGGPEPETAPRLSRRGGTRRVLRSVRDVIRAPGVKEPMREIF